MGPDDAVDAVRRGLQMGAEDAVHVVDDAVAGSDVVGTARVLAAAIRHLDAQEHVDLVILGMAGLDGLTSLLPTALAELLDLPALPLAAELTVDGSTVRVRRNLDHASEVLEATLPALVSVTDQANEPRYPNFKGIMAARKKPVTTLTLADLEVDASRVGLLGARTEVLEAAARPPATTACSCRTPATPASASPRTSSTTSSSDVPNRRIAAVTAPVLVLVDHTEDGAVRAPVRELLTLARELSGGAGVHAAWAVDGVEPSPEVVAELAALGATHVHRVVVDADPHLSAVLAEALASLLDATGAGLLLVVSSFENKEAAARLAISTGAGVVTDADGLALVDGRYVASKTVFAGTWNTTCAVTAPLAIVALKPNSVQPSVLEGAPAAQVGEHAVDREREGAARHAGRAHRAARERSSRPGQREHRRRRWSWHRGGLLRGRGAGRRARRGRGRHARRHRRGLDRARRPDRPDGRHHRAAALRRRRRVRCRPPPRGHAGVRHDRRDQLRPRRPDLRDRGLRRRR